MGRIEKLEREVESLTPDELAEFRTHDRFVNRDLDKIERRSTQGPSG